MSGLCAGFCMTLVIATAASAEVIEIRPDGAVVTYSGPATWLPEKPRFLQRKLPPRASRFRTPRDSVARAIHVAASRHQLGDDLLRAVAWQESHWNTHIVSVKGARGIMQLMPETAATLHVNPNDIVGNVDGGAEYLSGLMRRFDGDLVTALAAYNAGPAAVVRYGGVPPYPETQKYVAAVLDTLADFSLNPQHSGSSQ